MEERFKCAVCVDLIATRKSGLETQVLLMRRKNTGDDDGNYELPGGHLESDEDLFDAMIRETKEELLVDVKRKDLSIAHIMHHYTGKRINFVFHLDGTNYNFQIGEKDKCDSLEWFGINNLPKNISNKMRKMIKSATAGKLYDNM